MKKEKGKLIIKVTTDEVTIIRRTSEDEMNFLELFEVFGEVAKALTYSEDMVNVYIAGGEKAYIKEHNKLFGKDEQH